MYTICMWININYLRLSPYCSKFANHYLGHSCQISSAVAFHVVRLSLTLLFPSLPPSHKPPLLVRRPAYQTNVYSRSVSEYVNSATVHGPHESEKRWVLSHWENWCRNVADRAIIGRLFHVSLQQMAPAQQSQNLMKFAQNVAQTCKWNDVNFSFI